MIAQQSLTNSKNTNCFPDNYCKYFIKGNGCYLYDKDNRRYIDYITALGTNLFGYANNEFIKEIEVELTKGTLYSLASPKEEELADEIKNNFPFIEMIKILKSGSESATASKIIARSYTKKKYIVSEGYHGWHDEFVTLTPPAKGCVSNQYIIDMNKYSYKEIEKNASNIAGVIIEPVITDISNHRINMLKKLRRICTQNNILLIYDETITAFRFPKLLFSLYSEVKPDLIFFGKAIANGLPISILGGSKEIMNSPYFVSPTFAGDTLPITCVKKSLDLLNNNMTYNIDKLWKEGGEFIEEFNKLDDSDIGVKIKGYPTRGVFTSFSKERLYTFFQEAFKVGVLFGSSFFYNFPLIPEKDNVLDLVDKIFYNIKRNKVKLEGSIPLTPQSLIIRRG